MPKKQALQSECVIIKKDYVSSQQILMLVMLFSQLNNGPRSQPIRVSFRPVLLVRVQSYTQIPWYANLAIQDKILQDQIFENIIICFHQEVNILGNYDNIHYGLNGLLLK